MREVSHRGDSVQVLYTLIYFGEVPYMSIFMSIRSFGLSRVVLYGFGMNFV